MTKFSCLLLLLIGFLPETYSQTTLPIDDFGELEQCQKLVALGQTQVEKDELQKDYWILLGIVNDLAAYRKTFLEKGEFINLFPTAYYHTTVTEVKRIIDGEFTYPIEKMKQMIVFYEAYKYNRLNWDSRVYQKVEEHWKTQFEYAINPLVWTNPGCSEIGEVLARGIIAHVGYDFPRTIKYAFDNKFNNASTFDMVKFKEDYDKTDDIFKVTVDKTLHDVANSYGHKWCFEGWTKHFIEFTVPFTDLKIFPVKYLKKITTYTNGIINLTDALLPDDVKTMRHLAYDEAFKGKQFIGSDGKVLATHPNPNNTIALISVGKRICPAEPKPQITKVVWRQLGIVAFDPDLKSRKGSVLTVNSNYFKTMPEQIKAAIAFTVTFLGNDCWYTRKDWWNDKNREGIKCKILSELNLGNQCSSTHLNFLKQWFAEDEISIEKLNQCPTIPYTATMQTSLNTLSVGIQKDTILVIYEYDDINTGEDFRDTYKTTVKFAYSENQTLKLIDQQDVFVKSGKYWSK